MTKVQFLLALQQRLADYPEADVEERLTFYMEMIEDRMEEGLSEEEAVAAVGSVEEIAEQIIGELPDPAAAEAALPVEAVPVVTEKKKKNGWKTALLIAGSPVWVCLGIAAIAVLFALWAALWAVAICFWAAFVCLAVYALMGTIWGILSILTAKFLPGVAMIGGGLVCAGLAIFAFCGSKYFTRLSARLTGWIFRGFKKKEG